MTTISADKIVQVNPNVLAAGGSALDLSGLFLTDNGRVPIGAVQSFADLQSVQGYFGPDSVEAAKAAVYFQGFSGSTVRPGAMLFAQYPTQDVGAFLRGGNVGALTLAQLQAIAGSLAVVVDGSQRSAPSVNLSSATSFSQAAGLIQTALNASLPQLAAFTGEIAGTELTVTAVASGALAAGQTVQGAGVADGTIVVEQTSGTEGGVGTYTVAVSQTVASEDMTAVGTPITVSYDSVSEAFVVRSGIVGAPSTIAFATGTIADPLLLTQSAGAVVSQGAVAASPGTFMDSIVNVTQDWASFTTTFAPDDSGNANKLAFAQWLNGKNNRFCYVPWDTDPAAANQNDAAASLGRELVAAGYSGTAPAWEADSSQNLESFVAGYIASIDFNSPGGRANAAFRSQAGLPVGALTDEAFDNLIANGYNFYGAWGTGGNEFRWLYPGLVSGPFKWLDTYVNQIWLNNSAQVALMNLLQNMRSIPFNAAGDGMIENALQGVVQQALLNGVIQPGVALSADQVAQVNAQAGVDVATTIQQQGWYIQVVASNAQVRAARGPKLVNLFYTDGGSVQKITLNSVEIQ